MKKTRFTDCSNPKIRGFKTLFIPIHPWSILVVSSENNIAIIYPVPYTSSIKDTFFGRRNDGRKT